MLVLTLRWQTCADPVRFALSVVAHIGITHRRQFTGGVLRRVSGGRCAVNNNFRVLVRQKFRGQDVHLIWR